MSSLPQQSSDAASWYEKGLALQQQGDSASAIAAFNQAVKLKPDFADACFALAHALEISGPAAMALRMYEHLLKIVPEHKKGGKKLAALKNALQPANEWSQKALAYLDKGDFENAVSAYRQSISHQGGMPEVYANLAIALHALRRFPEAHEAVKEALRLRPQYPQALNTLASIYQNTGNDSNAIAAYKQAIAIKPDYLHPLINLGKILQTQGDSAAAVTAYESALAVDGNHADLLAELLHQLHYLCRWEKVEALEKRLLTLVQTTDDTANPFIVALHADAAVQFTNAQKWAAKHYSLSKAYDSTRPLPADARANGKLRIGYLSSDFHHHATAFLISELFERHDRSRFEIYAYSSGPKEDTAERSRIMKSADKFIELNGLIDQEAADQITADGIDILVDLKGHTQGHRLPVITRRPAPLQMHYLAYPGTIGGVFIDYFIADPVAAPPALDAFFSEKLIRLPHSYQMNDRTRALPSGTNLRTANGLPEDAFVFCVFNRSYKITPAMYDVWMRLLKSVEGSVLWMCESQQETIANVKKEAEKRGVSADRIIIAPFAQQALHLARYQHADLFLDTAPVCGHTTASDALWCGVPVVTLQGESFISRVAASLLVAVGLPELIAPDLAAYEALALALARDPVRLAQLKKHLVEGRMRFPLFDSEATTHAIEAAYLHAAELHRKGQAPHAFSITADSAIKE